MRVLGRPLAAALVGLMSLVWSRAQAQGPAGAAPVLYSGPRSTLTVLLPTLRDARTEREGVAQRLHACRNALEFAPGDSARIVERSLPPLTSAAGGGFLEVTVAPRAAQPVDCGSGTSAAAWLESGAVLVALDDSLDASRRIKALRVSRGGAPLPVHGEVRLPLLVLGTEGVRDAGTALRLAIAASDLLPTRARPGDLLVVEVEFELPGAVDRFEIPWDVLRELWDAEMPRRTRAIAGQIPALRLPLPEDEALRRAAAAYANGDASQALRAAVARLRGGALRGGDAIWARAVSAMIFAAGGDTLAARIHASYLLREEPCFDFDPAAPALARVVVQDAARPARRCVGATSRRVALQALAFPGFGRPSTGSDRLGVGVLVGGFIVGTAARSQLLRQQARDHYREYLAFQVTRSSGELVYSSPDLYIARARDARADGIRAANLAATAYVLQWGYALWAERRYAERVRAAQRFGRPLAAPVDGAAAAPDVLAVAATPDGRGLLLRWYW